MTKQFDSIADVMVHQSPMLLVDSVISWNKSGAEIAVNPKDSHLFFDERGKIPSWVGIEYMAQAMGAFSGIEARQNNEDICLGFLLGTRKYTAHVDSFEPNQPLRVKVRELLRDETNLVLFDCQLFAGDALVASAEVKAVQPHDLDVLKERFKKMSEGIEE